MFRPLLLSLTILLCTAGCLSETDEPYDTEAALAQFRAVAERYLAPPPRDRS